MEDSNYFVKSVGLESFISHEKNFCGSPSRVDMNNLDYNQMEPEESVQTDKDGICGKQDVINDDVIANVQADDFFSSLELQSSSKISSTMLSLNFPSKLSGGIVTRSRSFSSTVHESSKTNGKFESKPKTKRKVQKDVKKKSREKLTSYRKARRKVKSKKSQKSPDKGSTIPEGKKQNLKLEETVVDKGLGFEKSKDENDWVLFNQLGSRREIDDKLFEGKHGLGTDLQNPIKRTTPELFSMSPILMSDAMSEGRDYVDKLLGVDDYDDEDPFLEMDEFNYAPPRSHTGGKWKPGSLSIRTSPMLWQNQTWDTLLDYRNHYEEGKSRAETPIESPTEPGEKMKESKFHSVIPSGGKWKPSVPPAGHTGGKWKPLTPPATYTGGKWKPSDIPQRSKKSEQDVHGDHNSEWGRHGVEPPATHTGGKWKPSSSINHVTGLAETISHRSKENASVSGKSFSGRGSALDVLASQSTSGKNFRCSKTSGGTVQYHCLPCNRRLSSQQMYKSHVQTDLHCRRVLQENDLEYDSRVVKYHQTKNRERDPGKRVIKKPELYKDTDMISKEETESLPTVRMRGKRISKREIIRCDVCKIKLPNHQLGKHLVSYYHSRRMKPNDPEQQKLVLKNIHSIVKQAPYQCGMCKFYCNTHAMFKKHWALPVHKELEQSQDQKQRFWCAFCSYECKTAKSMELHLDSNSHREVIWAVNKSMPIIIRHKVIFTCKICDKEFLFKREWSQHQQRHHSKVEDDPTDRFVCSVCQHVCKGLKSLQTHVLSAHKNGAKIPYFCRFCDEHFSSALEAKIHRNGQLHKYKRNLSREGETPMKGLSRTCVYCLDTLENIDKLKSHFIEKHPEHRPRCIKCGKVFALSQEVSQHVKNNECDFPRISDESSNSPDSEVCDMCAFTTTQKSEMLLHVAIHKKKDNKKKIMCPLCDSSFTQTALRIHLRAHLNETIFKCSICWREFIRKDRYVKHLKKKHFINKTVDPFQVEGSENEDKDHEKGEKEPSVERRSSANRKPPKEREEEEFEDRIKKRKKRRKCGDPKCRYLAKDNWDLEYHCRIHVGPKTFQCTECSYTTTTKTILKRHLVMHADSRLFPCPHCPFKAKLKAHLKRHLKIHSFSKPFKCPYCPYACNILENLRKHVLNTKRHVGKKLFECKICGFDTNVSKQFITHYSEIHQTKDPKEAFIAAGVYERDEDSLTNQKAVRIQSSKSHQTPKKTKSPITEKDLLPYTKKFCPIAPKSPSSSGKKVKKNSPTKISPEIELKTLEIKLNRVRTEDGRLKSYPSPVEKDLKMKAAEAASAKETNQVTTRTEQTQQDVNSMPEIGENQIVLVNVLKTEEEDEVAENIHEDNGTVAYENQEGCPYVLCKTVGSAEDMEFYVLEDYELVENEGLMYLV